MLDNYYSSYQVYVLRLWRDGPNVPWRAALECARTGERHPFAGLTDLFAFLVAETHVADSTALLIEDTEHRRKVKQNDDSFQA